MAIAQAVTTGGVEVLRTLLHHSDRGVQYCCNEYVAMLQQYGIRISMTEDYKPTDNAIAERINGVIKTEIVYRIKQFSDMAEALRVISRYISFYNCRRPHMSIGYKTPEQVHSEKGTQQKMWKIKIYHKNENKTGKKDLTLLGQTTSRGESLSWQP